MIDVDYWGSVDDPTGYGAVARGYTSALSDLDGIRLKITPVNFFPGKRTGFSEKHANLLRTKLNGNHVTIQHFTPNIYKKQDGVNVGYAAWELDRIPRSWIRKCNSMDEMWVPSNFSKSSFEIEGVDNVHVIPHGIDFSEFTPEADPIVIRNKANFNFLSIFQWNYRKGYDVLLEAYLEEFSTKDDVALIIKTHGFNNSNIEKQRVKSELFRLNRKFFREDSPKILLINDFVDNMASLYTATDAFVLPVRGGGWEMCYLEALSCGLPVIGTLCGGQSEFMNNDNAVIVKADTTTYCEHMEDFTFYDDVMKWNEPDLEDLRKKMRLVYESESLRAALSASARASVLHYTWNNAAKMMAERIKNLVS